MQLTIDLNEITMEQKYTILSTLGLIFGEEPLDKRTKTGQKSTKKGEPIPEPTPETEKPVESKYELRDLKEKAQQLVKVIDRDKVKATIQQYAEKLSDVKASDYEALMGDFNELG